MNSCCCSCTYNRQEGTSCAGQYLRGDLSFYLASQPLSGCMRPVMQLPLSTDRE